MSSIPPFRDEMTRFSTTNFNLQRFWEPGACVCFQVQSFGIVGIPVPNPGAFSLQLMVSSLSPPSKQTDKQWRPKSVGIKTTLSCKSLLGPTITTEHRWRNGGHWYNQIHRQSSSFGCLKHCWSFPAYFLIGSYQNALCKYLSYLVGIDSGSVKMGRILKWAASRKRQIPKDASSRRP